MGAGGDRRREGGRLLCGLRLCCHSDGWCWSGVRMAGLGLRREDGNGCCEFGVWGDVVGKCFSTCCSQKDRTEGGTRVGDVLEEDLTARLCRPF